MAEGGQEALGKPRRIGCSIAGWALFLLAFAAIGVFGYRVWFYYDKIRRGEITELPQFSGRLTQAGEAPLVSRSIVERSLVEGGDQPSFGAENAKLVVVEFADFECPYSKEESVIVRRLMTKYGDKVRFLYRDYPLASIHPNAFQASVAAECAREQGKFWPFHDKLYANATALGFEDLMRYAEESGMDRRQFERCVIDERYKDNVENDMETARALGLQGTPTFFFNGQKIEGAIPEDIFEKVIDRLTQ